VGLTNAERQRRYIERLKAKASAISDGDAAGVAALDARVRDLESQLAQAKARITEPKRRDAEPAITPDMLSMSAQEKFDAAIRQYKRKLGLEFESLVRDEVKRRIDEIMLPHLKQQIDQAQQLFARRRGLMDKATFNKIRRGLHPDSRNSITDKTLGEAFDTFMSLEKYLLNEKDSPTTFPDMPSTIAEWDKMRQKADAARKAKRSASKSAIKTR
jgi:hypothetical protein